jgi:hypothetical protein
VDSHGKGYDEVVDQLLVAVGRAPNVEGLGLENVGVEYDKKGVKVNDRLQTANPRIFACGDICSPYQFTHAADFTARIVGWKVHATIVCAARSCPPLQREAFTSANLETLIEQSYRAWLGREDLNRFDSAASRVSISPIFKWFKGDFIGPGTVAKVLARYAPDRNRASLEKGDFKFEYLEYHWGLNDQSGRGRDFRAGMLDRLFGNAK